MSAVVQIGADQLNELATLEAPFLLDTANGLVVDKATGEAVLLADAPDSTLARLKEQAAQLRQFAREVEQAAEEILKERIGNARSLDAGTHLVQLERKREWDPQATWDALCALVDAGVVDSSDAEAACPERLVRKCDGRKLNALLTDVVGKAPEAAQALAQARSERTYIKLARQSVDGEVAE